MAYVVATSDQKEAIKNLPEFQVQVKWAVINEALYWKNDAGTGKPDAPSATRWATHRLYSTGILNNPSAIDSNLAYWVGLFAGLLNNYQVVDNSQGFDASIAVAYMLQQSFFQAMADTIFDNLCAGQVF